MITKIGILIAFAFCLSCWEPTLDSNASLTVAKLTRAEYPPTARAARVSGVVNLEVAINEDGSTKVVARPTGPEMSKRAAIESAEHSTFKPVGESHKDELYELTYTFKLKLLDCGEAADPDSLQVQYMANAITITGQSVPLCDPAADRRVRSVK